MANASKRLRSSVPLSLTHQFDDNAETRAALTASDLHLVKTRVIDLTYQAMVTLEGDKSDGHCWKFCEAQSEAVGKKKGPV